MRVTSLYSDALSRGYPFILCAVFDQPENGAPCGHEVWFTSFADRSAIRGEPQKVLRIGYCHKCKKTMEG